MAKTKTPAFPPEDVDSARRVGFGDVLTHIGAYHKRDAEYNPRANKRSIRVLVTYKTRNHRFVFTGDKWVDDLAPPSQAERGGGGAIDFVRYLANTTFENAVSICLAASKAPSQPLTETQLELPFWPDYVRSMPNEIVRSALFTARHKTQPRQYCKNAEIAVIGDGAITYTGEELRQYDETVWLQLIDLARKMPPGQPVEIVAKHFCEAVKWPLKSDSYDRLRESLTRMQATSLTVTSARLKAGVSMSMIPRFEFKDPETGQKLRRWRITVAPELVKLFGDVHYTWIEWQQRLALPVGIATWLHGFLSSHKEPRPIPIAEIVRGAALLDKDMDDIRKNLRRALEALKKEGFLTSYKLLKEHLVVERKPRTCAA